MMKMINKDKIWNYAKWILFFVVLHSFGAWFFWGINKFIVNGIAFFTCVILATLGQKRIQENCIWWFIIYAFSFLLISFRNGIPNLNGLLGFILKLYPIGVFFLLKPSYKHDFLLLLRKGIAIILAISLITWILFLIGVPLPYTQMTYGTINDEIQYYFHNYYVFLLNRNTILDIILSRFQSIFIEPGYLGCLLSLLLYNGRFILKKNYENIIYLIALLFTFSLAGYLLTAAGFIATKLEKNNRRIIWLITIIITVIGINMVAQSWNNGDNVLNQYVIGRLQYENGTGFSGYNRSSEGTVDYFWDYFVRGDKLWLGGYSYSDYSSFYRSEGEVSAYSYIMQYGLFAFLVLFFYFYYPFIKNVKNRFEFFCIGSIVFLTFAQTIHMTHSFMYVLLYVACVNDIEYYPNNKRKI